MQVHQQTAYVLLNRPYSETSWIVEVFSRDYGRLALMAKGARRIKSNLKGVLLPFQPVLLSWSGKGEIPTLTSAELLPTQLNMIEHELDGEQLVCGFYCNELIMYLLHRHDPHATLFDRYHQTILGLYKPQTEQNQAELAHTLREFERMVIKETGYEVSFNMQADGKSVIMPNDYYLFHPGQGFLPVLAKHHNAVQGRIILSLQPNAINQLDDKDIVRSKHLMRDILSQSLGYKKIHSRELFFPKLR